VWRATAQAAPSAGTRKPARGATENALNAGAETRFILARNGERRQERTAARNGRSRATRRAARDERGGPNTKSGQPTQQQPDQSTWVGLKGAGALEEPRRRKHRNL